MTDKGAQIIVKSKYINATKNNDGQSATYAQYMGTREGAVLIKEDTKKDPATESQIKFINELIDKDKSLIDTFEYKDYLQNKTIGNASKFIEEGIDQVGIDIVGVERYAQYMATRPGSIKIHDTGLFSNVNENVELKEIQKELKEYKGNIYTPIISLRPEASIGYGYDNPEKWQQLLTKHKNEIAKEYSISPENFRWVAAYHHAVNKNGEVHNHVHMLIWSKNKNEGWQSKQTPAKLKQILAKDIFNQKQNPVYDQTLKDMTFQRDAMRSNAKEIINDAIEDIKNKDVASQTLLSNELLVLANSLKDYKGRFYYNYLSRDIKPIVDNIVDDMFKENESLQKSLDAWAIAKDTHLQLYKMDHYETLPASKIDDVSKPIKNQILKEVQQIILNGQQENIDTVCMNILKQHLPEGMIDENKKVPKKELKAELEKMIPYQIPNAKNGLTSEFEMLLDYKTYNAKDFNNSWKDAYKQTYKERNASRKQLINAFVKEYGIEEPNTKNNFKKKTYSKKPKTKQKVNKTLNQVAIKVNPDYKLKVSNSNINNINKETSNTLVTLLSKLKGFGSVGSGGHTKQLQAGIDEEELKRQAALEGHVHHHNGMSI